MPGSSAAARTAQIIVVSSVMFTFISYWRTAAVVLCDMSSTVYYIGAIVETAIGKAAPWFILGVLLFSYAMRSVYIESSAIFVRGGVYRVVKEAMGGFLAKLSVSALMFDYVLTGPISGVSAGQYIIGLGLEAAARYGGIELDESMRSSVKSWGSVLIACAIVLYFFRQNLLGMHESSDKALKIMLATTLMGIVLIAWCGVTLATKGANNPLPPFAPDLSKKVVVDESGQAIPKLNPVTGEQEDPLGFLGRFPSIAEPLRQPGSWLSLIGVVGIAIAFGHSILAMSGEETLAQVYREVESPKLPNFKKAAFIVFLFSLLLTGTLNLLAVLLIPDAQRMGQYYDNWMGGLAMQMVGPLPVLLILNAFVVIVGFLILSGAVNTSIIGSSGVLSRVAEDGVLPDWFLKPHARYGTNSRILYLIVALQLLTIVYSQGDVILLGEAYAFGVVWSFVFKTASMLVLRFKDRTPREYKVPFNVPWQGTELPVGLGLIFLVVLISALANLVTKPVATVSGAAFTLVFLAVFVVTELVHHRRRGDAKHEHVEQFNRATAAEVTPQSLRLTRSYRKLIAIRSTSNLFMLEKALVETDPQTTDVVVMTAKITQSGGEATLDGIDLDLYDQKLMTAVVERAERAGKMVKPLIVPTNSPLHAVLKTARDLQVQELVLGASNKYTAEEQLDQLSFYWISLHQGRPRPLTVRILSRNRDLSFDIEGGNRIPKIGERQARSVAELRAAGVGIERVLLAHDNTPASSDLFQSVLTLLDPGVELDLAVLPGASVKGSDGNSFVAHDQEQAVRVARHLEIKPVADDSAAQFLRLAQAGKYDLVIVPAADHKSGDKSRFTSEWIEGVLGHAPCAVFLASRPPLPQEVEA
jgi:amino acid transporter